MAPGVGTSKRTSPGNQELLLSSAGSQAAAVTAPAGRDTMNRSAARPRLVLPLPRPRESAAPSLPPLLRPGHPTLQLPGPCGQPHAVAAVPRLPAPLDTRVTLRTPQSSPDRSPAARSPSVGFRPAAAGWAPSSRRCGQPSPSAPPHRSGSCRHSPRPCRVVAGTEPSAPPGTPQPHSSSL